MANAIVGTFDLAGPGRRASACRSASWAACSFPNTVRSQLNWWIRFAADVLNGVPSIIWGIVVYALVVVPMQGFSALAGGVVLGMMMIPLVMRTTEEVLLLVPNGYREAALALGIAHWRTIVQIVVRTALKGIVTGVLLALARVAGETAPLLFTAFGNRFWTHHLSDPIAALPLQIFNYAISPYDDWHRQAWAGALVLLLLVAVHQRRRALSHPRPVQPNANVMTHAHGPTKPAADRLAAGPPTGAAAAGRRRSRHRRPALTVRDLSVFFGANQVLKSVSLDIPARAVTAIIGPSGCGKSTFLRALNRMHELVPDARMDGEIRLFGEDIYAPRRRAGRRPPPRRHGLPEIEPVPDHVHRRERHRRPAAQRRPRPRGCSPSAWSNRCAWRRCGTR